MVIKLQVPLLSDNKRVLFNLAEIIEQPNLYNV